MNPTIDLLKSHRSIRKFTDQQIPRELLLELIRAGQAAATSSHVQAYSVIHVRNPANRERIAELAGLRASGVPYVILKPGRLTDEPATERVAASLEETGGTNTVSRGTSSTAGVCTWYISCQKSTPPP
ncbi:nitroreductase family protein [Halomonas sp. EGI 63088]|uniref:Nitroreductase family protein n=1 Tax=Halomonas flagellata TaxID=2920385 RepID=A0ABS9RQX9_9GAMM|nr:nitroreductase family protein [Halomonas flagellata]MCH4562252.1 nitroreductase family protein [Halomonas flagellata]